MKLPNLPILVLDTETTGFVPVIHRVIEYACAIAKDGKLVKEYEQLLSTETNDIPAVVQVLTQITPADLAGKPTFGEVMTTIEAMLEPDMIVVGQNVTFDLKMLKGEGWDITGSNWIDTAMLASVVYPELKSYSLGYMSEVLGLDHTPKHRALGDVRATMELLGLCIERLESLPADDLKKLQDLAARGPESYKRLFASVVPSKKKTRPAWLSGSKHAVPGAADLTVPASPFPAHEIASVQLVEESLNPATLASALSGAKKGTVIAVKNLDATLRRVEVPESIAVLPQADSLLSMDAAKKFLEQPAFTADELTLAMKLVLYTPKTKTDLPIHGDEYSIWTAKLAASAESPEYQSRYKKLGTETILIGHHELISIAASDESPLSEKTPVLIDDASMLEDTATQALGWTCFISTLRAAAAQHEHLTKCTDLIELWAEKTRGGMDLRYLAPSDLEADDVVHLKTLIEDLLKADLPHAPKLALTDLLKILDPANLAGRITWIEAFQDGSKTIKSVPEKIADVLTEILYSVSPTTLLVPRGGVDEQEAIVPSTVPVTQATLTGIVTPSFTITTPVGVNTEAVLTNVTGKRILLLGSKRAIEDLYVKHAARCEKEGITLLCQGFSGGQSRMQAEFTAATAPAVMVTTPWMYETMELPTGTIEQLVLQTLPFDHPAHPVFSRRANRYRDPFGEYSLPRLTHRLFRLIRTFCRHTVSGGSVLVMDDRLRTKQYGQQVRGYLLGLAPATVVTPAKKSGEQLPLL